MPGPANLWYSENAEGKIVVAFIEAASSNAAHAGGVLPLASSGLSLLVYPQLDSVTRRAHALNWACAGSDRHIPAALSHVVRRERVRSSIRASFCGYRNGVVGRCDPPRGPRRSDAHAQSDGFPRPDPWSAGKRPSVPAVGGRLSRTWCDSARYPEKAAGRAGDLCLIAAQRPTLIAARARIRASV